MGNINSRFKLRKTKPKPQLIPKKSQEFVNEEKELADYYLSNNDFNDLDRQHMHNFIIKYIFQGSFSAPVEENLTLGCKVLDVACGPATWLLDLASKYENSIFFGLDIKPIFPREIKPSNLKFVQADILNRLPFRDNNFEFTHIESMVNILTTGQWDFVLSELIRVTKPGGYIEITDLYLNIDKHTPILYEVYKGLYRSCLKRNVNIRSIIHLNSILESKQNIGTVHRDEKIVIFGPNGGKAGLTYQEVVTLFLTTNLAVKELSAEMRIPEERFKKMIEYLKEELKGNYTSKGHVLRFWAQKIR
ncbi:S-adenosyl-L-methionine-dependent methyltransferase [Rhizophagus clarus]|uniref:S-adenosyl-L-methionine-dependent methyltransferase n=1 Tax=Rhizophagus clarus TaxID=94130 RepID=A0A8H3M4T6_9GLOM|nr:S-adenosyl-L-methionine-dependent methyltransferase [Rhizophagus clarus]